MAQIIRRSYFSEYYRPELITEVGSILSDPAQSLIMIASKSFEEITLPKHEKWYNFNYSSEKMSQERLNELESPEVKQNGKRLDLPPKNKFIAKNFDLLPEDHAVSQIPLFLKRWDGIADLWYKKDDKFKMPKAIVACTIYTNDLQFGTSAKT